MLLIPSLLFLLNSASAQQLASAPVNHHYATSSIVQSVVLQAPLTRLTTVYTLQSPKGSDETGNWIIGFKGSDQGYLEALAGKTSANKKVVELTKLGTATAASGEELTYYSVDLSTSASSSPITLTLTQVQSHLSIPKPRSLPQTAESVFLSYTHDLLSSISSLTPEEMSQVQEMKIKIKVPTPRINNELIIAPEGFVSDYTKGSTTITFTSKAGLFEKESNLNNKIATVEYQQPAPVVTIRKLDRLVEVSHWGSNLAIEDAIDLYNSGPLLKGQFSRLDHQKNLRSQRGQGLSINDFTLALPSRASSPYYVDIVGNVSTSNFRPASTKPVKSPTGNSHFLPSLLQLTPRYPLMGGWNYTFTIGYNTPLSDSVKEIIGPGERRFSLKMPFLTAVPNVAVDDVRVRFRLPEGAYNIKLATPFPLDSSSIPSTISPASLFTSSNVGVEKTYLDSTGRPTVILEKRNCGDRHGGDVVIEYSLPYSRDILQKPMAIASVLSIFFLSTSLIKKINWTI